MVRRFRKNERGVALLAVLLGVALMTLVVVDFAMTSGLGFVSAANQANELRAYYMARSGISVGLAMLAQDERAKTQAPASSTSGTAPETLSDAWATAVPTVGLEGGNVSVSIVDEARKLNINQMVVNGAPNQRSMAQVERLFTILDVDTALIPGIVQWITPASATAGGGGADYYMGLRTTLSAARRTDADDCGFADGQRNQRSGLQPSTPVFDRVAGEPGEHQYRIAAGDRVARAGVNGGSADRRGNNHGAATSAVFQSDRPDQRYSLSGDVRNASYSGRDGEQ